LHVRHTASPRTPLSSLAFIEGQRWSKGPGAGFRPACVPARGRDIRYDWQNSGCGTPGSSAVMMGVTGARSSAPLPDLLTHSFTPPADQGAPASPVGPLSSAAPSSSARATTFARRPSRPARSPTLGRSSRATTRAASTFRRWHVATRKCARTCVPTGAKRAAPMATRRRRRAHYALVSLRSRTPHTHRHAFTRTSSSAAICPNNIATTINDFISAFFHDLMQILRLILSCFGPGGPTACVCNVLMLLKPVRHAGPPPTTLLCSHPHPRPQSWIANLPSDQAKCKGANTQPSRLLMPRSAMSRPFLRWQHLWPPRRQDHRHSAQLGRDARQRPHGDAREDRLQLVWLQATADLLECRRECLPMRTHHRPEQLAVDAGLRLPLDDGRGAAVLLCAAAVHLHGRRPQPVQSVPEAL
jgi:hypothetical protein